MTGPGPITIPDDMKEMMARKEELEKKIGDLTEYLNGPNMPGAHSPLVDEEGFPLSDIDLYAVRNSRYELSCAQNDHCALMKKLEEGLYALHGASRVAVPRAGPTSAGSSQRAAQEPAVEKMKPFALIDEVSLDSPAFRAGIQIGDKVLDFGGANLNHESVQGCFQKIQQIVPQHVDAEITVLVRRGLLDVPLKVIPMPWSGRGLLGCHLTPIN